MFRLNSFILQSAMSNGPYATVNATMQMVHNIDKLIDQHQELITHLIRIRQRYVHQQMTTVEVIDLTTESDDEDEEMNSVVRRLIFDSDSDWDSDETILMTP